MRELLRPWFVRALWRDHMHATCRLQNGDFEGNFDNHPEIQNLRKGVSLHIIHIVM